MSESSGNGRIAAKRPDIFRDRHGARWIWRACFLVLFIAIGAAAFVAAWTSLGLPPQRSHGVVNFWPYVGTGIAIFVISVLAIWLTMRLTERRPFSSIGLRTPRPIGTILTGAVFGCLTPVLLVGALYFTGNASVAPNTVAAPDVVARMLPLLIMFICMAGFEELILRGYLLQLLIEGLGKWWAVLLTSAIFGLMHAANPGADPIGLIATALNGALLALVVIKAGSLVIAWAYHAAWNAFSTLVLGLNVSGHNLDFFALTRTTLSGPDLLTGGAYGFEASVLVGPMETVVLLLLLLLAPKSAPDRPNYFDRTQLRQAREVSVGGRKAP